MTMLSLKQVKSNYGIKRGPANKAVVRLSFLIVWILDTINMALFFQFELKMAVDAALMKKKIVKWTSNAFLRKVNFIFDVFSRVSFPFKYRKAIFWQSWRLKSQNYPLAVNHVHDTDLSKLGNLCQVKNISLISTPDI